LVGQYGSELYTDMNLSGRDFIVQADWVGSATVTYERAFDGGAYWFVDYVDLGYQLRT